MTENYADERKMNNSDSIYSATKFQFLLNVKTTLASKRRWHKQTKWRNTMTIKKQKLILTTALFAAAVSISSATPSIAASQRFLLIAEHDGYLQIAKNRLINKFLDRRIAATRSGGRCEWRGRLKVLKRFSTTRKTWSNYKVSRMVNCTIIR